MKKEKVLIKPSFGGCWFGQGSGHGCCGNYSGCCYYWHTLCYVHDKMCADCTPRWFCFSGCVPDKKRELQTLDKYDSLPKKDEGVGINF